MTNKIFLSIYESTFNVTGNPTLVEIITKSEFEVWTNESYSKTCQKVEPFVWKKGEGEPNSPPNSATNLVNDLRETSPPAQTSSYEHPHV